MPLVVDVRALVVEVVVMVSLLMELLVVDLSVLLFRLVWSGGLLLGDAVDVCGVEFEVCREWGVVGR